jgi:hypothetical protein
MKETLTTFLVAWSECTGVPVDDVLPTLGEPVTVVPERPAPESDDKRVVLMATLIPIVLVLAATLAVLCCCPPPCCACLAVWRRKRTAAAAAAGGKHPVALCPTKYELQLLEVPNPPEDPLRMMACDHLKLRHVAAFIVSQLNADRALVDTCVFALPDEPGYLLRVGDEETAKKNLRELGLGHNVPRAEGVPAVTQLRLVAMGGVGATAEFARANPMAAKAERVAHKPTAATSV